MRYDLINIEDFKIMMHEEQQYKRGFLVFNFYPEFNSCYRVILIIVKAILRILHSDKKIILSACLGTYLSTRVRVVVFNATFNNISVISWRSVLLVEETAVPIYKYYLYPLTINSIKDSPNLTSIETTHHLETVWPF